MANVWTCPYCKQNATIIDANRSGNIHYFNCDNKEGDLGIHTSVIVCPNGDCKEYTIEAALYRIKYAPNRSVVGSPLLTWSLKPDSKAKSFPAYIPEAIRQDYEEACKIASLSPKASATLSRRCLQGIIRDFWNIKKARLVDEIDALSGKIDSVTWDAIDAVRKIGNIGAHMEKDINIVVDVDPDEAELLIGLIEVLLEEWYVHRYEREQHMQKVIAAAQAKAGVKAAGAISAPPPLKSAP
ncbi:DUF4145 domain-containing protein [Noviherbaspirillum denitrificans]|uniref:DUF4145 domain-containing protein n=1 Tax=Noviherbaspirillum denitrificans TaxID=1968433 RepID=A0A254TFF7_9BURK|nr:DUF4145 domain-containing protein [Noviherbaspirillum denitrificans]OWW18398.1 hypothetical protein AYR66_00940 [Noviherbaspirillum denitrificans]OWW19362.1 hypothetical protein AYR66_07425 [Noviherbaspirillum denitrificans]